MLKYFTARQRRRPRLFFLSSFVCNSGLPRFIPGAAQGGTMLCVKTPVPPPVRLPLISVENVKPRMTRHVFVTFEFRDVLRVIQKFVSYG